VKSRLLREFLRQSDDLVDCGNNGPGYRAVLRVVHCINEEARKKRIIEKTIEAIHFFSIVLYSFV